MFNEAVIAATRYAGIILKGASPNELARDPQLKYVYRQT